MFLTPTLPPRGRPRPPGGAIGPATGSRGGWLPPPSGANAAVGRLTIGRTQRGIPAKLPHKRAACLAYTYARMQAVLPMNRVGIHFYVAHPQKARSEERRVGKECRSRW